MQTRTVIVGNISDLAGEREVREFFSFSGEIEHLELFQEAGERRTAFVTFRDPKALEIALLLSGATIVDQTVRILPVVNYISKVQENILVNQAPSGTSVENNIPDIEIKDNKGSGPMYVNKAQDVMTSLLARGSAIRQVAVNKAKTFNEKHQLTANVSTKVISFDRHVGLSEKINFGISVVNEKVKLMDQKLHVSEKTMAVLIVADKKLYDSGSAVKTSRYVSAGTTWLNGAFSKMAQAGHVAGAKTRDTFQSAVSNLTRRVRICCYVRSNQIASAVGITSTPTDVYGPIYGKNPVAAA